MVKRQVSSFELLLAAHDAWLGKFSAVTQLANNAGVDRLTLVALQCAVDVFSFTDVDDQHLDGSFLEMEHKDSSLILNGQALLLKSFFIPLEVSWLKIKGLKV